MQNVIIEIKGNIATITFDLSKELGRSKSGLGPNMIIATSSGNVDLPGAPGVKMGLNVYKPA